MSRVYYHHAGHFGRPGHWHEAVGYTADGVAVLGAAHFRRHPSIPDGQSADTARSLPGNASGGGEVDGE